jgi:hypothetical protein
MWGILGKQEQLGRSEQKQSNTAKMTKMIITIIKEEKAQREKKKKRTATKTTQEQQYRAKEKLGTILRFHRIIHPYSITYYCPQQMQIPARIHALPPLVLCPPSSLSLSPHGYIEAMPLLTLAGWPATMTCGGCDCVRNITPHVSYPNCVV